MQAEAEKFKRKYALARIAKGDYLLPSNDGLTIWRLSTYTDGPSNGLTDWPRDRAVWGVWKWIGDGSAVDTTDWSEWEMYEGPLSTRTEAIQAALRMGVSVASVGLVGQSSR